MIFLSLRVTADAVGGLKNRALVRPVLQGFGGGQPPTSTRRVYTGALLAGTTPHISTMLFMIVSGVRNSWAAFWEKFFCIKKTWFSCWDIWLHALTSSEISLLLSAL